MVTKVVRYYGIIVQIRVSVYTVSTNMMVIMIAEWVLKAQSDPTSTSKNIAIEKTHQVRALSINKILLGNVLVVVNVHLLPCRVYEYPF